MIAEITGADQDLCIRQRAFTLPTSGRKAGDIRQGNSRASERRRCIDLPFSGQLDPAIRFAGRVLVDLIRVSTTPRVLFVC